MRMQRLRDRQWPLVGHLFLVELYLDRATEAWRALQRAGARDAGRLCGHRDRAPGTGALPRPLDSGYRGADYDFISAVTRARPPGRRADRVHARHQAGADRGARAADARAARARAGGVGARPIRTPTRRSAAPSSSCWSRWRSSRSSAAARRCSSSSTTAPPAFRGRCSIPIRPAAIRARGRSAPSCCASCARSSSAPHVHDASADDGILIIGEPDASPEPGRDVVYPRLPGARDEANAVAACFAENARTAARAGSARCAR